jgi:Na+/melibiose symporter-like transporter
MAFRKVWRYNLTRRRTRTHMTYHPWTESTIKTIGADDTVRERDYYLLLGFVIIFICFSFLLFLFYLFFSSSCVPYDASFSGLSMFGCTFGILQHLFHNAFVFVLLLLCTSNDSKHNCLLSSVLYVCLENSLVIPKDTALFYLLILNFTINN